MQENIRAIVQEMTEEGYSSKEISCFVRGLHEGMKSVQVTMGGAKMKYDKNETDPLYMHTWNNVVEAVEDMLSKLIEGTFGEIDEETI